MASSTRSAWRSFVAFTKRHENTHRSIYIQCGNNFVAKAQRLTSESCGGLQASIRRLLEAGKARMRIQAAGLRPPRIQSRQRIEPVPDGEVVPVTTAEAFITGTLALGHAPLCSPSSTFLSQP